MVVVVVVVVEVLVVMVVVVDPGGRVFKSPIQLLLKNSFRILSSFRLWV